MKPVLLMIPGLFNDASVFADVAVRLDADAEIRIADVSSQTSIAAMAADAWALVGDVPTERPVVPCGFSMGGYVAIAMLARAPRPAAALALIDTSGRPEAPDNIPVREKTMAAIERDIARTVENLLVFNLHPTSLKRPALVERLRRMMLGVGAETAVRQLRAIVGRADHRDVLAALDLPALVVCGDDDRVLPPELSRELARQIRGAVFEGIPGAGHYTPVEQPDAVANALRALLRRIAA